MDIKLQKLMEKFPKQADFIGWLDSYFATNISIRTLETENNEVIKTMLFFTINGASYELVYNQNDTCELYYLKDGQRVKRKDLKIEDLPQRIKRS